MFSINTNNSALAALQSLQATSADLTATQNAISTGKKVASASDSPAIYSISQSMQGQISGLSAVSDSLNFGQSAVGTAMSAAANISASLISLRQVVTDGLQTGLNQTTLNNQITQVNALIAQYANAASFNGVNLLVAGNTSNANVTNTSLNVVQGIDGSTLTISNALSTAVSGALGTNTDILATLGLTGLTATASGTDFSFSSDAAVVTGNTFVVDGVTTVAGVATEHSWTFEFNDGTTALTSTPSATNSVIGVQMAATTQNLSVSLSELVAAMNGQGFAASLNSSGDLVYTGNGSLGTTGVSDGVTLAAGPTATLTTGTATATGTASNAVTIVAAAIDTMDTIAAYLGSASQQITGMQTFTSSLSDALTSGVGALVDADMTAESARLTSLQTKQSLAIQALSIANQQPQSLLTLFR